MARNGCVEVRRAALPRVGVLIVNATEAGRALGTATPWGCDAWEAVTARAGIAVVTLGSDGAVLAGGTTAAVQADGGSGARHVPVPRAVPVLETTGAGDAFAGALAARPTAGGVPDDAAAPATPTVGTPGRARISPDFGTVLGTGAEGVAARPPHPGGAPRDGEAVAAGKRPS